MEVPKGQRDEIKKRERERGFEAANCEMNAPRKRGDYRLERDGISAIGAQEKRTAKAGRSARAGKRKSKETL